jgi:hypothetical protein
MVLRVKEQARHFHLLGDASSLIDFRKSVMRKAQGRLPFEYAVEKKGEPSVTAFGGLPLVVEGLRAFGVTDEARTRMQLGKIHRQFDSGALLEAMCLLMSAGGDCIEDIERLRADAPLCTLLDAAIPSSGTLRQALYAFHDESLMQEESFERARIPRESELLRLLQDVFTFHLWKICDRWDEVEATLDIDGTIIESHKKEALPHYMGGRGYQPVIAFWAETGLAVWDQFRDGNVPGHMRTLEVLQAAFSKLPPQVAKRRMRGDVAFYSPPSLQWLSKEGIEFAIGAKKRRPLEVALEAVPESSWAVLENRRDTELAVAELNYQPKWAKPEDRVRYIGIRMRPLQHSLLETPSRKTVFLSIVTNSTLPAAEAVRWYWAKAGTIEKLHDVVKNELGGGVLPCGRFGANAAWFRFALLTHNVLQTLKRAGPKSLRDARPKRLRFQLFSVPATVIRHARSVVAKLADIFQSVSIVDLRDSIWRPVHV